MSANFFDALYTQRLLVFLEVEPQSNKYRQVLFNSEEYKKMTSCIGRVVRVEGEKQIIDVNESVEVYTLPDLQDVEIEKKDTPVKS